MSIDLDFRPDSYGDSGDPEILDLEGNGAGEGSGAYPSRGENGEVEIACVSLQSIHMDYFSLRARWSGGRYHYRMVDVWDGAYTLCRRTSRHTLTLRQVIEILETVAGGVDTFGAGLVATWWDQQWESGDDPERCTDFVSVYSEQYPELAAWYGRRAEAWRAEREAERAGNAGEGWDAASPVDLRISLPPPQGWRWVPREEWEQELDEWDVDLEARTGITKEEFGGPLICVVNTPPGYEAESPTVQVGVGEPEEGEGPTDTERSLLLALGFMKLAFDDFDLLWGPEPVVFKGHLGHKAAVRVSQPRRGKPTLHFEWRLVHLSVGYRELHVALGAPAYDAPEGIWDEIQTAYEAIGIEVRG